MNFFPEALKKRLCRYALQRYLGNYILEKLQLDQLSLQLSSNSGVMEVERIMLDVKGLNELSETQHWPFQFIEGYIDSVKVEVPWSNILSDNSRIRVHGLNLTIQPTSWADEASMFESMYSSMMSSKQMAEEIFRSSEPPAENETLTGLDQCAAAIETIFNRVIVSFTDTTLRLEQIMHEGETHFRTAFEIAVGHFEYHDAHASSDNKTMLEELASRSTKKLLLNDVQLFVDRYNPEKEIAPVSSKMCGPLCATSPKINSSPVQIALLKGTQEVEICVNRSDRGDHPSSPKIGVKVTLSEIPIYIEPRQILHLTALLNSFVGATDPDAGIQHESPCTALGPKDFAVMENDLQAALKHGTYRVPSFLSDSVPTLTNMGSLSNTQQMWAGGCGDDVEEQYLPMNTNDSPTTSQLAPDIISGTSMTIQSEFSLHIGTVYMVILEENSIGVNEQTDDVDPSDQMKKGCLKFFKEIEGVPLRDITTVTTAEFLPEKHFRLVLHPVQLNGRTYTSPMQRSLEFKLTVSNADLVRGRKNWVETILGSHLKSDNIAKDHGASPLPFLRLKVSHKSCSSITSGRPTVTDIKCDFGVIHLKYDRLLETRLLEMFGMPVGTSGSKKFEDHSARPHEINIDFTCPLLSCDLRFQALEVANIRKELRPDALTVTLEKIQVTGKVSSDPPCTEFKILFRSGYTDYRPNAANPDEVIQLARVFSDPEVDDAGCGAASILIKINSAERNLLQEHPLIESLYPTSRSPNSIDMTKSMYNKSNEDGPFKQRRVAPSETAGEEVILAGESKLIQAFYDQCQINSKVTIDVNLPTVVIEFANRELLEIIYNRVLVDLAYTPRFETHFGLPDLHAGKSPFFERNGFDKSVLGDQFYYSATPESYDEDHRFRTLEQNQLCLSLNVQSACALVGHGSAEKGEYFSFQIKPQQILLYVVNGYQGDANNSFVMLHATDVEVRHQAFSETPMETHSELTKDMMLPREKTRLLLSRVAKETFGKLRPSSTANNQSSPKEMLCFVLRVRPEPISRIKKMTMAISVEETAWRHELTPSRQLWISQLIELATLKDLPVAGHEPSAIVTELHFNLDRSLIDYRPLYIPYNCILNIDNFSLSTNVVPKSSASTLRLIFENTSLLLASHVDKTKTPDIYKDYVCVIHADLLDFRIVLSNSSRQTESSADYPSPDSTAYLKSVPAPETGPITPVINFTASNNELQIRTCADSFYALQAVALYLASDGDLVATRERTPSAPYRSPSVSSAMGVPTQQSSDHLQNGCSLADDSHATVSPTTANIMEDIEDAMSDSDARSQSDDRLSQFSCSSRSPSFDRGGRESSPADAAGRVYYNPSQDNEFLILESLPGSGHLKDKTQESIRVINGDEIVIIDNYLKAPSEKTDLLKAPEGYPDPVETYTFQQQKLVWYLYQGKDFGETRGPGRITDLKSLGGQGRETTDWMELVLTKIRFRHELYAPNESKTSRQCALIKDIEIIDHVAASRINKFLYQLNNEEIPRQANAQAFTLKITHMAQENECSIYVSLSPLRLNIDQDALIFFINFFSEVSTLVSPPPASTPSCAPTSVEAPPAVFIKSFVFGPDVPIKIDYNGKHISNFGNGALNAVLMGLASFKDMQLVLKSVKRRNFRGYDKILTHVSNEWYTDITGTQLQTIACALGPLQSISKLLTGICDLVREPVESYRRDGQIVRGFQKGTKSFGTNAASALIELTTRIISVVQGAAVLTYNVVSPTARQPNMLAISQQPLDVREGVHSAYRVMANGINDTARFLAVASTDTGGNKGVTGVVGDVLRQIPPAVVRPIIDVTTATTTVLNGVKYQIQPEARQEDLDKWKPNHNGRLN